MIRLEMLCTPALISETAFYLREVAASSGVSAHRAYHLCFVIESVMDLRMRELEKDDPTLLVEARIDKSEFMVSITDKGLPYALTSNQKKILKSGLVDRFLFEQLGAQGQRISFFFMIEGHHDLSLVPPVEEETLLDKDFVCRFTTDSDKDIIRVIQCIYSAYGYNYLHQELYRTDIFRKMLRSGKYLSMLVENAHHQVVGHIALEEHAWFPGLMEACNLVVKPLARGNDIAGVLLDSLLENGAHRNLRGAYGMPVMFHPISQKLLSKHGYTPCGMYFHILPADAVKGREHDAGRLDTAFCMHTYDKTTPHGLFVPSECAQFIQDVFGKEQMPFTLNEDAADQVASATTSLSINADAVSKLLEVKVDAVGDDLSEHLDVTRFEQDLDDVEIVTVYLNMNDSRCPAGYEHLRSLGFIFSGCLPGSKTHDYLVMRHLKGRPIIKENIVALPDYAEMLEKLYEINGV